MEVASSAIMPMGPSPPEPASTAHPLDVLEHLANVLQVTLGAARRELEAVGSLLSEASKPDSLDRCARFASEAQPAVYAQKCLRPDADANIPDAETGKFPL